MFRAVRNFPLKICGIFMSRILRIKGNSNNLKIGELLFFEN
eukprot:UN04794